MLRTPGRRTSATASELNGLDLSGYVRDLDDFLGAAVSSDWSFLQGTDAAIVAPAITVAQSGVARIVTGAGAGASMAANGVQYQRALQWKANQGSLVFECRYKVSAITAVAIFVGFTDQVAVLEMPFTLGGSDALTSNAADAVGVLFDTGADTDNFWLVGVKGDADATKQDAGTALVADTYVTWRIELSTAGAATFFKNGVQVGTAMDNAVTATVALTPVVAAFARGASSRNIDIDYLFTQAARV